MNKERVKAKSFAAEDEFLNYLVLRSRSSMFCPEVPVTLVPPTENMYGFVADFIVG